jgi:hypothetical protein
LKLKLEAMWVFEWGYSFCTKNESCGVFASLIQI